MAEERTVSTRRIYEGRTVNLRVDEVELPNGRTTTREIVEHRGAVALLPVDGDGNILFVRQFRKAVDRTLLELPAGTLEPDEEPDRTAARELAEETGHAGTIERLGGFFSAPGFCSEYLHVYLASDLRPVEGSAEEDEDLELVRLSPDDALARVASGEICDAKTIVGLLLYDRRRRS